MLDLLAIMLFLQSCFLLLLTLMPWRRTLLPADAIAIALLLYMGPLLPITWPFLSLYRTSDDTLSTVYILLSMAYSSYSVTYLFCEYALRYTSFLRKPALKDSNNKAAYFALFIVGAYAAARFLAGDGIHIIKNIVAWGRSGFSTELYKWFRSSHADADTLNLLLTYASQTILPFALLSVFSFQKTKLLWLKLVLIYVVFVMLIFDFKKQSVIFPALYIGAWIVCYRRWRRSIIPYVSCAAIITLSCGLTVLYMIQYPDIFVGWSGFAEASKAAVARMTSVQADALAKYVDYFMQQENFLRGGTSPLIASLLGIQARPDLITTIPWAVERSISSNPTVFVGALWADFGYVGVIIGSCFLAVLAHAVNIMWCAVNTDWIRNSVFAVMFVNLAWIIQVPLPTILLTYGVGWLPVFALFMDWVMTARRAHVPSVNVSRRLHGQLASPSAP